MLNEKTKEKVFADLQKADREYSTVFKKTVRDMERLNENRNNAVLTIKDVEIFAVSIANIPRNISTKIDSIRLCYTDYSKLLHSAEEIEKNNLSNQLHKNTPFSTVAISMSMGLAPTLAVSSLMGETALLPALSWIGGIGGSLSIGGMGLASGLLGGAFGPIGIITAGVSIPTLLLKINKSNKDIVKKGEETITAIKKENNRIKMIDEKITVWNDETRRLNLEVKKQLFAVRKLARKDYSVLNDAEKKEISVLFNSTEVLSQMLNKTIDGDNI